MRSNACLALMAALPVFFAANGYAQKAGEPKPTRDATDVLTVTGCVQREADYRAKIGEGKGGVAGTGLGESHEFVLRNVRTVYTETLKPLAKPGNFEEVYRMTGKLESELGKVVGHKVAVSGYVKEKETNGTAKVADLPDMVVIGWHNVADSCSLSTKASH